MLRHLLGHRTSLRKYRRGCLRWRSAVRPAEYVAATIAAYHRQRAQEHAERLRTDPAYRARASSNVPLIPTFTSSGRKLPPWPLGPLSRVERVSGSTVVPRAALASLMGVRPEITAEVLLATMIEAPPEEEYGGSYAIDPDFGLAFDRQVIQQPIGKAHFLLSFRSILT